MNKRLFISTGINEFDDLLTRISSQPQAGLAVPTVEGAASSILVIKGPVGVGKSILASILAFNMHCQPPMHSDAESDRRGENVGEKRRLVLPFVIYFSYSQPAQGIYHYIDDILLREGPSITLPNGKAYPLVLSPREFENANAGMGSLERFLDEHLRMFSTAPFPRFEGSKSPWCDVKSRLQQYLNGLVADNLWHSEIGRRPIIPEAPELDGLLSIEVRPFVFVDSINFFFDHSESRQVVAKLLHSMRDKLWPMFATIEDAGSNASEMHRQLMSFVEFEADAVVELAAYATPYIRHTVEVKKNRNSQPRFGLQQYRIERRKHSLWNIPSDWTSGKHPGFLIMPSIHWFLSHARERHQSCELYHSGMSAFDDILRDPPHKTEGNAAPHDHRASTEHAHSGILPADAVILIRGEKGGHKLSLGFNLLVAGLWDFRKEEFVQLNNANRQICGKSDKVLLLSLGEEIGLSIPRIALCRSLLEKGGHNNGDMLEFAPSDIEEPPAQREHAGFKIVIREWKARPAQRNAPHGPRLVEATFKPGNLSPEEFLWVVESLVKHHSPSRVMVENTAHLRMRFPELHRERMLFPALASLTQSQQIMLIVTDVLGTGSDEQLSYGLAASADFVIDVEGLDKSAFPVSEDYKLCFDYLKEKTGGLIRDDELPAWSKMTVSNVRGKNYRRGQHAVSVFHKNRQNSLLLLPISRFFQEGRLEPLRFEIPQR